MSPGEFAVRASAMLCLAFSLLTPDAVHGQTLRWYDVPGITDTGTHNWHDPNKWTTDIPPTTWTNTLLAIPNGIGQEARFDLGGIPSAGLKVNLASDVTLGQLAVNLGGSGFPGNNAFTLASTGGKLILDNGSSEALVTFDTGTGIPPVGFISTVSADLEIRGAAAILNQSAGGYYQSNLPTITGAISGNSTTALRVLNGDLVGDNTGYSGSLRLVGLTRANTESLGENVGSRTVVIEGAHYLSHDTNPNPTVQLSFDMLDGSTFQNMGPAAFDGGIRVTGSVAIHGVTYDIAIRGGISEAISGSSVKLGTMTLSGTPSTYTGGTTIGGGGRPGLTLADNQMISNQSDLRMEDSSTLRLNGVMQEFNRLDMMGRGNVDFGTSGNSVLRFADSTSLSSTWLDTPLTLKNYVTGSDQMFVSNSNTGLTSGQLRQIRFADGLIYRRAVYQANGELTPGSELLNEWVVEDGEWGIGTNWDVGYAPDSGVDVALFGSNVVGPAATVSAGVPGTEYRLNELRLDTAIPVDIDGSVKLRFSGNESLLQVYSTNTAAHTIAATVTAGTPTTIRQRSSAELTLSGQLDATDKEITLDIDSGTSVAMTGTLDSDTARNGFVKSGDGTLRIDSNSPDFRGVLRVASGAVELQTADTMPMAEWIVDGGTVLLRADQTINSLATWLGAGYVDLGSDNLVIQGPRPSVAHFITNNFGGTIFGSGNVTINNLQDQRFFGRNDHTGDTIIDNATLRIDHNGALGMGETRIVNNGILELMGPRVISESIELAGTIRTDAPLPQTQLTRIVNGDIRLTGASSIQSLGGHPFRIDSMISDDGMPHTLTLSTTSVGTPLDGNFISFLDVTNANTYSGPTTVTGFGIVRISNTNALGSTGQGTTVIGVGNPAADATLALGNSDLSSPNTVFASESLTLNGVGYGVPAIDYYSTLRTDWDLGGTGALRNMHGDNEWTGAVQLASSSRIGVDTNSVLILQQGIGQSGGGPKSLTKVLRGTLELRGAGGYTGNTLVNSGTLRMAAGSSLSPVTNVIVSGADYAFSNGSQTYSPQPATFELATSAQTTVDGLSGGGIVKLGSGSQLSVGANGQNDIGSGGLSRFEGTIEGSGDFHKIGLGRQLLTGSSPNTYSGATHVSAGELRLGKQDALGGTNVVRVDGGRLVLDNAPAPTTDRINDQATFEAVSGVFDTNGFAEFSSPGMGTFDLLGDFALNLGTDHDAGNIVWWSDSASHSGNWNPSATLSILNWNGTPNVGGGGDQILFGPDLFTAGLTRSQLSQIRFDLTDPILAASVGLSPGFYGAGFAAGRNGEIVPVPVPEPGCLSSVLAAALLATIRGAARRRLKIVGLIAQRPWMRRSNAACGLPQAVPI